MALIPTSLSPASRLESASVNAPVPQVRQTVVLAGAEAHPLREAIEKSFSARPEPGGGRVDFVLADSILEAVFLAAEPVVGPLGVGGAGPILFAGVSREAEQLESAIRSLRQVYADARVYLLCDAGDEVLCRKARSWGATGYLILPVETRALERALTGSVSPGSPPVARDGGMDLVRSNDPGGSTLVPLAVQTTLLHDLMTGRPQFLERALAALQSYAWEGEGTLTLDRSAEGQPDLAEEGCVRGSAARVPVLLPGLPTLGTLVLERPSGGEAFTEVPAKLLEAAQWLGALVCMSQRYEQLRAMAITDELSGAYNRRYFNKFMAGLLERARLNRFRVTLLLFDIDDFKKYNDSFGHASGDAIIRELIQLLRACTRPHDIVARLGGDEFAVVYWDNEAPRQPNSQHPKDVLAATERFRNAIKSHEWPSTCNIQGQISISGGLATFPWDADSLEQLMAKADEALLRAKAAGKNAILLHGCDAGESPDGNLPSRTMTFPQN